MVNPFESLSNRLSTLEAMLLQVLNKVGSANPAPAEVGGIDLAKEVTRLSKPRIYALVSARGIPHFKRGNKLYFNRAELVAWVTEGRRGETPATK